MLQKRGIAMKMKGTLFSLSTLALTAALLLSGCGSEKKKETSPSSTSKIAQVKESSTTSVEKCSICNGIIDKSSSIKADGGKTLICKKCFTKLF